MSYDLYFHIRQGLEVPAIDNLRAYFETLQHFELKSNVAVYLNKDTGVYFNFEFTLEKDASIPPVEEGTNIIPVSFNINYYRPHTFGIEAELVLSAFVRQFNLLVRDYQVEGMGEGEYSAQGFLKGWNLGNEVSYRELLNNEKSVPFSLPAKQIEAYWSWNYNRDEFQNSLGDDIFVPRVMFIVLGGIVEPVIVWTDGIPTVIPDLDTYLVYRKKLVNGLFNKKPNFAIVKKKQIDSLLSRYHVLERNLPYRRLEYQSAPKDIESFIKSLPPYQVDLKNVSMDHILDKDVVLPSKSSGI